MSSLKNCSVSVADKVATLVIDRPAVRNAIDRETSAEILGVLADLAAREDVGAFILTGAGDKVFASGADLRQMQRWRRNDALAAVASRVADAVERFPKPTIAAINGAALGGGCELALACDLRIAAQHAIIGQPEVGLGVVPAAGGTQRLPRIIGLGRAKHMVLTGDPIDAPMALAWGLVSTVVPAEELIPTARAVAARVLSRGPLAVRLAKMLLNASSRTDLDAGLLMETLAQAICFESDDRAEGTAAFLERRPPRFGP